MVELIHGAKSEKQKVKIKEKRGQAGKI